MLAKILRRDLVTYLSCSAVAICTMSSNVGSVSGAGESIRTFEELNGKLVYVCTLRPPKVSDRDSAGLMTSIYLSMYLLRPTDIDWNRFTLLFCCGQQFIHQEDSLPSIRR